MKVRRTVTLALGAVVGASGMYLLDPEHGPERRRDAAKQAWERTRSSLRTEPAVAADRVRSLASRARDGFASGREVRELPEMRADRLRK